MARKRKTNTGLPRYVYLIGGSYKLRVPAGTYPNGKPRFTQESFATLHQALNRRAEVLGEASGVPRTVRELIDHYQRSDRYADLRTRTQRDYNNHLAWIADKLTDPRSGKSWPVTHVQATHCYTLRTTRGKSSKTQANRMLSTLKVLFEFAREVGCRPDNPAKGVRRYSEKPRQRYVTDAEFDAVFRIASPMMQVAMTLAAITGVDQGVLLRLRFDQFDDDGLEFVRAKTGKAKRFVWSPALRWCHDRARELPPRVRGIVICREDGEPYTSDGFRSIWHRLMCKAVEEKGIARFMFRDLRRKAGTDSDDWRILGNSRAIYERVYNVKPQVSEPTR